jgi:hypothetical protein
MDAKPILKDKLLDKIEAVNRELVDLFILENKDELISQFIEDYTDAFQKYCEQAYFEWEVL